MIGCQGYNYSFGRSDTHITLPYECLICIITYMDIPLADLIFVWVPQLTGTLVDITYGWAAIHMILWHMLSGYTYMIYYSCQGGRYDICMRCFKTVTTIYLISVHLLYNCHCDWSDKLLYNCHCGSSDICIYSYTTFTVVELISV